MPLYIRSKIANKLATELAARRGISKTEAVRQALVETLAHDEKRKRMIERLDEIARQFAMFPRTGLEADKAFFDSLEE